MELDRFQVLKSYAESIKALAKWDKQLARELAYDIIMFGIYGEEPENPNPVIECIFNQIKIPIQNCRNKSWNAKKNWEKVWNQIEIKWNSNGNQNEITWISNDNQNEIKPKENIKYKKENIKDNNINNNKLKLISEDKSSQEEYWNKEVNLCLNLVKKYNNWIINGSETTQRRYAYNLIRKLKKMNSVEKGSFTWEDVLEWILVVISNDEFYRTKIASPKLIYDNLASLIQRCWAVGWKSKWWETLQVI